MKANNGTGNNIERDEWETPEWLWDKLDVQYKFKFDCCANINNTKCKDFHVDFQCVKYKKEMSWMNPPFSIAWKMFKHFFKVVKEGIAIYRCDNFETKIWQDIIFPNADWVFIPSKRIAYEGMKGKGSRFPSALIGKNVEPPLKLRGTCLVKKNE